MVIIAQLIPDWQEIERMSNPLTPGERALAKYFERALGDEWEVYLQPFLNGDRPDLVLLHPRAGIMIWEVKDWHLEHYSFDSRTNEVFVRTRTGKHETISPVKQADHYRQQIISLYNPLLGEKIDMNKKAFGLVKIGVYFHHAKEERVKSFFHGIRHATFLGYDSLRGNRVNTNVPLNSFVPSKYLTEQDRDIFTIMRTWLNPPFHSKEQGEALTLSPGQLRHAKPSPGHHRFKGVAGSGKTFVLAYRAASLAAQGKMVLIITFNITLWHFIRDQISRAPFDFSWKQFVFKHFHGFCNSELVRMNKKWPRGVGEGYEPDEFFTRYVPDYTLANLLSPKTIPRKPQIKYDAILIDEGQDYCWEWYNLLCHYLNNRDELVLVCDDRQNIYERNNSWIDGSMSNVKFRGPWGKLPSESYRLSIPLVRKLNLFAREFLPDIVDDMPIEPRQMSIFDREEPELSWENYPGSREKNITKICYERFMHYYKRGIQPSDIIFLVMTHKLGWRLVDRFEGSNIKANHVFEYEEDLTGKRAHYHKKSFWMGDGRLKISTMHSFKGWELHTAIVLITNSIPPGVNLDYLIYTALSRAMHNICVLNFNERYNDYGDEWETQQSPADPLPF